jgi:hypothetical protein
MKNNNYLIAFYGNAILSAVVENKIASFILLFLAILSLFLFYKQNK